ncbi:MAG: 2-phosphosulfolactate phosphatase [Flammeovirgaceae bacterium]|nr:2-phosphosulfolactate phosphatase [Flammeovirgaceae bacterium]
MSLTIEVCLTPKLINQHTLEGKIAVVADIFRATSCIVTALSENATAIYPVSTMDECLKLGTQGMLTAGERGGIKIKEFNLGNSPFEYMGKVSGKEVAISTTNGTIALEKSKNAEQVIIGSFLNITATINYLIDQKLPVIIHCAGWKGAPNIEDTLYAGALVHQLIGHDYLAKSDSAKMALDLYRRNKNSLLKIALESDHAKRLKKFGITKDLDFCLQVDKYPNLNGRLMGSKIIKI